MACVGLLMVALGVAPAVLISLGVPSGLPADVTSALRARVSKTFRGGGAKTPPSGGSGAGLVGLPNLLSPSLAQAQQAKILYVAEDALPTSLNPLVAGTLLQLRANELIHDSPFRIDDGGDLRSSLIARNGRFPIFEPFANSRGVEGQLKDAKFHDGTTISVSDLGSTFAAYSAASDLFLSTGFYKDLVTKTETVGPAEDHRFKVHFGRPIGLPRVAFTVKLLPRDAFKYKDKPETWPVDRDYAQKPIGAGPFQWVSQNSQTLELSAFDQYHKGRPLLDGIKIVSIPEPIEKINALRAKQIDVIVSLNREDQGRAVAADGVVRPYPVRNWWYLGFHCKRGPLADVNVRRALGRAIDRETLAERMGTFEKAEALGDRERRLKGAAVPQGEKSSPTSIPSVVLLSGPFVSYSPYYNDEVPQPEESNSAEALEALKAAGFPGLSYDAGEQQWYLTEKGKRKPWSLDLAYDRSLAGARQVVSLIEQQLEDLHIKVNVFALSPSEWKGDVAVSPGAEGRYDLMVGRWNFDFNDDVRSIFQSSGNLNIYHHESAAIDGVIAEFNRENDPDLRVAQMQKLHKLVADEMPMFTLWEANQVAAFSPDVRYYRVSSLTFYVNPQNWDVERP